MKLRLQDLAPAIPGDDAMLDRLRPRIGDAMQLHDAVPGDGNTRDGSALMDQTTTGSDGAGDLVPTPAIYGAEAPSRRKVTMDHPSAVFQCEMCLNPALV